MYGRANGDIPADNIINPDSLYEGIDPDQI